MTAPAHEGFPTHHPLRDHRARLDAILDLMWWEILKILHHPRRPRGRPGQAELTLVGGTSAEDVLQEALIGLLRHEPDGVISWEALGVRIAQNKAKGALRKSRAYRTRGDESDIEIAPLEFEGPDGRPVIDTISDDHSESFTEEQALAEVDRLQRQIALHRAARQVLPERDRAIVSRIQRGETREAICGDYGVSRVRIGQIYAESLAKLRRILSEDGLFDELSADQIERRDAP
ncbi:MAG: sigma-70 family RNA polymerase sigma factor [Acidimicrobiia bacterium]|jgi:RNA polymerase sigma factor (sigma-70 family)